MATTITSLIPDAYAALNIVSREMTGLVLSVNRDSRAIWNGILFRSKN
jgi:hypothetical protein